MFGIKNNGDTPKPRMKTSQKLHTAVSMLALTVIALTTATYAWFTLSASTRVTQFDLDVTAGTDLRIATRGAGSDMEKYYKEVIDRDSGLEGGDIEWYLQNKYSTSLDNILISPQTSGNGVDLYTESGNVSGTKSRANLSTGSFMQYDLYLIAEDDMRVHLSTVADEDGVWTHVESGTGNTTEQEDVVECVRISFESTDKSGNSRVVVWEPEKTGTTTLTNHAKTDNGGVSTQQTLKLPPENTARYDEDTWICELEGKEPKLVTVRIWIEGEDEKCKNPVQEANFVTEMRFQGTDFDNQPIS